MAPRMRPVDLNGTHLDPSSGARFDDAVASATTREVADLLVSSR